ncbi:5270_t:CDS:1, partial [Racocetra persica]
LQVSEEAKKLAAVSGLRILAIYGGTPIQKQLDFLQRGVEVVVGTPGRIIDHLQRQSLATNKLKFVILDEVDEMISQGFLEAIEKIIRQTPASRQTLLFSATITPEVKTFSQTYLKNPEYVVSSSESPQLNAIAQYYVETPFRERTRNLINFLRVKQPEATLVFARTKKRVERLQEILTRAGCKADYLHSDLSQSRRIRVLGKFRNKQIPLLVATDVAARGIDIKGISHVINYDLPQNTEFYIHRIGRTGRGGKTGQAISFVSS